MQNDEYRYIALSSQDYQNIKEALERNSKRIEMMMPAIEILRMRELHIKQEQVRFLKSLFQYLMKNFRRYLSSLRNKNSLQDSILRKLKEFPSNRKFTYRDIQQLKQEFNGVDYQSFERQFLEFLQSETLMVKINNQFSFDLQKCNNYKVGVKLMQDEIKSQSSLKYFYSKKKDLSKYNFFFPNAQLDQEFLNKLVTLSETELFQDFFLSNSCTPDDCSLYLV